MAEPVGRGARGKDMVTESRAGFNRGSIPRLLAPSASLTPRGEQGAKEAFVARNEEERREEWTFEIGDFGLGIGDCGWHVAAVPCAIATVGQG